ncbi:MAG TPA: hypothetical protein VHK69_17755, partial [Chitinophagaceae bacterium]|nr:hypothetical protein [Chitinophagaceae bacterium]
MKWKSTWNLCLLASFLLFAQCIEAQTTTKKTVRITSRSNGFVEHLPAGYASSTGKFPVLFYLHGYGARGFGSSSELDRILAEGVPYFIKTGEFPTSFTVNGQSFSFVVIAPQFQDKPSVSDVDDMIDYFLEHYPKLDPDRIYLTGFSVGGDATFKYPASGAAAAGRLAAIVPTAPFNHPYSEAGAHNIAAANLPVRGLHCTDDKTAPSWWTTEYIEKINSYNPTTRAQHHLFSGYTHGTSWQKMFDPEWKPDGKNMYEWMLQYTRDEMPEPENTAPDVNAGSAKELTLPDNSVTMTATASDADGSVASYSWSKVSGPSAFTFSSTTVLNPTVSNLTAGTYVFRLTVEDNDGATATDDVQVVVHSATANQAPAADAGADRSITLPENSVTLEGSGTDADGSIASYQWRKVSGPSGGLLSDALSALGLLTGLVEGTYVYELIVTDNDG